MLRRTSARRMGEALAVLAASYGGAVWAAAPEVEYALKLTPVQKDVDYDKPAASEISKLSIKTDTFDGKSGWVIRDAQGQILRRFLDTNADGVVDQWSYFLAGVEVYRDIDANNNGKADQYRWLHMGGARWGLDKDEDGKIDEWRFISAEEVSAEVAAAVAQRDVNRYARLLLKSEELKALGLGTDQSGVLAKAIDNAKERFQTALSSDKSPEARFASAGTKLKWLGFGGAMPGMVPIGTDGSTKDVLVYENVLAMVDYEGKNEQLPVGMLVKVDQGWRLVPGENLLFTGRGSGDTPPLPGGGGDNQALITKHLKQIEEIDAKIAKATGADVHALNAERAGVLEQLAEASTARERETWYKQLADTVSVAAQSGNYPGGIERLKSLSEKFATSKETDLAAYTLYRHMTADYYSKLQQPNANYDAIQKEWLASLKAFVTTYGQTDDAAEAHLQLGVAEEFASNESAALDEYKKAAAFPASLAPVKKSQGAIARLQSVGRPLALKSSTIDNKTFDLSKTTGKVVVLHYWASWCVPFQTESLQLLQLQAKYAKDVVLVGINLDDDVQLAKNFMQATKLPWTQLWEAGGMDSNLANQLGIVQVPTMLLIDKQGKVAKRSVHITDLDKEIGALVR